MTTPEERPLEPGTIVASNYQVAERLGAGGMGTVYLANNVTLEQRVVVKVLRGSAQGAGQEEAQIMANLQHPNVVTVYAHDPALDCIVMEFLDGASLSAVLEKGIDRVNAIRVALAVAEALAAVHRRGLVHRDIKPENVMLALNHGGGGGRLVDWLKLIDFGLALKAGKLPPVLLGTPEFCGPEQFLATEVAHPANDVYALGITIFLMMTGAFPFDGPREELPQLHFHQPPPGLVEALITRFGKATFDPRTLALLEDLDELLQQMLAKRIEDRPTAQEVARRLTRLESSFAEAGTYVGSTAAAVTLTEHSAAQRRRSGTSVLTPKHVSDSSSTAPDVQAVTLKAAPALPSSRQKAQLEPEPDPQLPRSNRGLIAVLLVVVAALAAAIIALGNQQAPIEVVTPAEPVKPVTGPVVKEEPIADAARVVVAPPVAPPEVERDAGLAPAVEDDPSVLGVIKKRQVAPRPPPKAPPPAAPVCRFDEVATPKSARREMGLLSKGASPAKKDEIEGLSGDLADAFVAKDCKAVEAVLKKMRALAAK